MKKIMHVVTSHKGGVGKTIKALGLASRYIKQKNTCVTLIDANPMNSNIADDLFYYFHREEFDWSETVTGAMEKRYTVSRDSLNKFSVIDATNIPLQEVISHVQNTPYSDEVDIVYIIDTNAHIKNLVGIEPPPEHPNHEWRQYFWFIWGWSIARLHHHPKEIFEAVTYLEQWFPVRQVIHVFNMYDFYESGFSLTKKSSTTMKPLMKCLKTIEKRIKLAKSNPGKMQVSYASARVMKKWIDVIRRLLLKYRIPQDLPIDKLPELWAETIRNNLNIYPQIIPYNVLLIPTFYEELVMAMDRLIMGEYTSWKEIYTTLKPMMLYVDQWATNVEQFGD